MNFFKKVGQELTKRLSHFIDKHPTASAMILSPMAFVGTFVLAEPIFSVPLAISMATATGIGTLTYCKMERSLQENAIPKSAAKTSLLIGGAWLAISFALTGATALGVTSLTDAQATIKGHFENPKIGDTCQSPDGDVYTCVNYRINTGTKFVDADTQDIKSSFGFGPFQFDITPAEKSEFDRTPQSYEAIIEGPGEKSNLIWHGTYKVPVQIPTRQKMGLPPGYQPTANGKSVMKAPAPL